MTVIDADTHVNRNRPRPAALERAILAISGVIDTGLFLGTADIALVADGETVRELTRKGRKP